MKLIILSVLLVSICYVQAQRSIALPFSVRNNNPNSKCTDVKDKFVCKDCNTIQYCNEASESEMEVKCMDQNPLTPYCNPTTHQCDSDSGSCTEATEFKCPRSGYFPDSVDCRRYVYCDKLKRPNTYACLYNMVYDHVKQRCVLGAVCYKFTFDNLCRGKAGKIVAYPPDTSLYALCHPDKLAKLKSCPKDYSFNINIVACEFVCKGEGNYPDADSKTSYYTCTKQGNVLKATKMNCPKDTEYDEKERMCESVESSATTVGPTTAVPTTNA